MMSERRALLDPEMYKISEEDSQDEEVLASYTDEALRLGGGGGGDRGGEDSANGNSGGNINNNNNNNSSVPRHSRTSWNNSGENSRWSARQEEEDTGGTWEFSGDFSSASQFNPSKLRIVHGVHHQHLRQRSTAIRLGGGHHGEDQDNSVDWPDTSTNSDSCLSGGDDGARRSHNPTGGAVSTGGGVPGSGSEGRFLSKTYFGDHLAKREKVGPGEDQDSNDEVTGAQGRAAPRGGSSSYRDYNNHRPPPDYPPRPQEGRSRSLQKRSRRPHQARNNELSSSGSEYSDDQQCHEDDSSISSSGSSSSPCTVCLNTKGRDHHHSHGRHHHRHRRHITSSSEVEEYDSSYSDSSYDDENADDNGVDYDDYDDDDDENEFFDDVVKFLGDEEVESSTKADGDLFLVEYSGDESEEAVRAAAGTASEPLPGTSNPDAGNHLTVPPKTRNPADEKSENGAEGREQVPERRNSADKVPAEASASSSSTHPTAGPPSPATGKEGSVQKVTPEKDTKGQGRISRLLKRKRTTALSAFLKTPAEGNTGGTGEAPSVPAPTLPAENVVAPATTALTSLTSAPPTASPSASRADSGRKLKGPSTAPGLSSTRGNAPEKVFRFKDEHGGETRTVFVDIPQSARTGNLLGRRATLIESILGIIPGHFSTPPSTSQLQEYAPQDQNFMSQERIMVAGFVPDGVASKYRRIKIGDWLQSVDDIPIDHGNVDQVLNSRSMYGKRRTAFETEYLRLKLTLRRVAGCMVSLPPSSSSPGENTESTFNLPFKPASKTCVTDPCWSVVSPHVQSNVVVLFIPNGTTTSSDDSSNSTNSAKNDDSQTSSGGSPSKSKDVVYSWPLETESKMAKALIASQGMFSTMYRLLWDVTGSHPVVSKVVIDDCEMDVTYTSDDQGKSLLLVGVATSLSTFTVYRPPQQQKGKSDSTGRSNVASGSGGAPGSGSTLLGEGKKKEKKIRWREPQSSGVTVSVRVLSRLESILKYQFGSFSRAFSDCNEDKMKRILANSLSALNDLSEDFIHPQVPGNFLRFPNCIRSGIDDVLYSFETSDSFRGSRSGGKGNRSSSSTSSFARSSTANDSTPPPVYHCHGSCLMYKGFLISSHLENDLASAFHGWWRTQLGLWAEVKRNAILDKWKPVSRLALWQETSILKKTSSCPLNVSATSAPEEMGSDAGVPAQGGGSSRSSSSTPRCFSGLVGIGNFTLGFVLEHLTEYPGSVGPDVYWLRRAMATICRLYQSGLSRSFECWMEEKQGGREEYVELCGTSPPSSASKHPPEKTAIVGGTVAPLSGSRTPTAFIPLKKVPFTGSILKNSDPSGPSYHHPYCALHTSNVAVNTAATAASPSCTCSQLASNSSPFSKSSMLSSSSTASSTSSSSLGGNGVRSGVSALEDFSPVTRHNPGGGDPAGNYESDGGADEQDADDTTTGTGSDNSSFKWYERAASEHSNSGPSRSSTGDVKHIRVSRGNVLIDYMLVEFGRGVMLTSKDIHGGWATAVRHNFRQSATVIHHILHKASNARLRLEERGQDKKWVSLTLAPISEHGILFNCQITDPRDVHKKKPRKRDISYWVVGRIYPDEREIYVCYEDGSLSQNLVEIAYKIALNVHS